MKVVKCAMCGGPVYISDLSNLGNGEAICKACCESEADLIRKANKVKSSRKRRFYAIEGGYRVVCENGDSYNVIPDFRLNELEGLRLCYDNGKCDYIPVVHIEGDI